jgi:hypothetical protein
VLSWVYRSPRPNAAETRCEEAGLCWPVFGPELSGESPPRRGAKGDQMGQCCYSAEAREAGRSAKETEGPPEARVQEA